MEKAVSFDCLLSFHSRIFYFACSLPLPMLLQPMFTRRFLILVFVSLALSACTPHFALTPHGTLPAPSEQQHLTGLTVYTHDDAALRFHENTWKLTFTGISGTADVETDDGDRYTTDTTLSYWDAASAAPAGRSSTMSQLMLTILGVILVLGLAGIILYAAFLATDR